MKSNKQKKETVHVPLCDPAKYRHLLNDPSLTDEKKDELILNMWILMEGLFKKIMSGQIPTVPAEGSPTSDAKQ